MEKPMKPFFQSGIVHKNHSNKGGVLPSVLVLVMMVGLLLTNRLLIYQRETLIYQQTKQFYQAKTLAQITKGNLIKEEKQKQSQLEGGEVVYNIGKVRYYYEGPKLIIKTVLLSGLEVVEVGALPIN